MEAKARVPFAALASVPFVMVLSNSMIIPVLPDMQKRLHVSLLQVGLLITVFSIAAGLIIPIGGYLSDKIGRKAVIIPSLVVFGAGGLLAGLAPVWLHSSPYGLILAGRVVQGIGAGGTYQVAMALAGDLFQSNERSRALGLLEASNGVGKVVSPIVGAALGILVWFAPFYLYPVIAWTSAVLVWRLVDEPKIPAETRKRSLHQYMGDLGKVFDKKAATLIVSFLTGALPIFFLFGVLSFFADIIEAPPYSISGVSKGLVIAIPVAVMAATSYVSGTVLVKRLARLAKLTVTLGLGLIVASFVVMFFVHRSIVPFTAAIAGMGLGNGLVLPSLNTMITSATGASERGMVTSLYGTARFFGAALGPPAFSKAAPAGPGAMFFGSAALAAGVLVLGMFCINQKQMLPKRMLRASPEPSRAGSRNKLK
ncbi:MAG TPA: MFS transporter [Bacillota bacterium]|nr:MFS transporter [Bacillota bacterium]